MTELLIEKPVKPALVATTELAEQIVAVGERIGLPFVAVSADISSPDAMLGADGAPLAETVFRWVEPDVRYWEDRGHALRSPFVRTIRAFAEPAYVKDGLAYSWRESVALKSINENGPIHSPGVASAILAPAHLAHGLIGAVVWATDDVSLPVAEVFDEHASMLHALSMRFIATYSEAKMDREAEPPAKLTRREVQCLKWAAAGKTDADIAQIVRISVPTVRFHITNAWRKLRAVGRTQAIYRAATLGYLGSSRPETH